MFFFSKSPRLHYDGPVYGLYIVDVKNGTFCFGLQRYCGVCVCEWVTGSEETGMPVCRIWRRTTVSKQCVLEFNEWLELHSIKHSSSLKFIWSHLRSNINYVSTENFFSIVTTAPETACVRNFFFSIDVFMNNNMTSWQWQRTYIQPIVPDPFGPSSK